MTLTVIIADSVCDILQVLCQGLDELYLQLRYSNKCITMLLVSTLDPVVAQLSVESLLLGFSIKLAASFATEATSATSLSESSSAACASSLAESSSRATFRLSSASTSKRAASAT